MASLYVPNVFVVIDRCAYVPTPGDMKFVEATLKSTKNPRELFRALLLTKLWDGKVDEKDMANIYSRIDKDFKENMVVTATFFSQDKKFLKEFIENFDIKQLDSLYWDDLTVRRNEGMETR